jgi:O-antigen/teichoic acid export membrane protein
LLKKISATFGTRLSTAVINFLIVVAVSQFLGAEGKGEQGILITSIALVLIFSDIIGGASLVYLAPRHPVDRLVLPSYLWSVMMGIIWAVAFAFFNLVSWEWAPHIAALSILNSWISIQSSILIGKERIGRSNLINLFQSIITILSLLVFIEILKVRDIHSYIFSLYIAYIICLVISIIYCSPYLKGFRVYSFSAYRAVLSDLFRFGFMNQLAHIAQTLSFRISYYFLDKVSGEKAVGVYSNGVSLMESVWMISGSIALVQYSKIVNTEDKAYSQQLTAKLTRYSLWASLFVIIPMIILPSQFYTFIFGPEFGEVNMIMRYLAPGIFIFNYALVTGHYFSGTGKYYVNAIASGAGLVVTIILSVILIPLFPFVGAAVTASISYTITSLIVFIWFIREAKTGMSVLLPSIGDLADLSKQLRAYLQSLKTPNGKTHGKNQ